MAPLLVLPGHVDFSRLPQQAFVQVASLVVLVAWLLRSGVSPLPRPGRRAFDAPLLAFLGASALSLLVAVDPGPGLVVLTLWTSCAIVYFVVSRVVTTPGDATPLVVALLLGGGLVAFVGLAQALAGFEGVPQAVAPASTLANRNVAAGHLVTVLPLALWFGLRRDARSGRAAVALALLIVVLLPFTRSRLALLTLAAQLAVLAVVAVRRGSPSGRDRWTRAGVGLALALSLAICAGWWTVRDPSKAASLGLRVDLARTALEMTREHPLAGVGLGSFAAEYPRFGPALRAAPGSPALLVDGPHSEPLHVLAESGVGGGVAFLWLALSVLVVLVRLAGSPVGEVRGLGLSVGLSLLGFALQLAFGFPLRTPVAPLVAAALLGVLAGLEGRRQGTAKTLVPGGVPRWRWVAATGTVIVLAGSLAWSARRLSADRSLALLREGLAAGREAEAVALGLRAVRLDPLRPELRLSLARAWLRAGRPREASRVAEGLVSRRPWSASALGTLGVARLAAGDAGGAAGLFAAVLQLDPLDSGAQEGLAAASRGEGEACPPDAMELAVHEGGDIDLVVEGARLDEVLQCLSHRMGFRLEFDGPAPADAVSLVLRDQPLTVAMDRLFEGLAVDYLVGLDPSGERVDRLIVVSASGDRVRPGTPAPAPSPGVIRGRRPAPPPADTGTAEGDEPLEPEWGPEETGPGWEAEEPGLVDQPAYEPEDLPEFPEPGELSPMTLGPGPAGPTYAVRSPTDDETGT